MIEMNETVVNVEVKSNSPKMSLSNDDAGQSRYVLYYFWYNL